MSKKPELICIGCSRKPHEIDEYISMADYEGITPEQYVWRNEGTLNPDNGHFLCDLCYIKAGMPSSPIGWMAP